MTPSETALLDRIKGYLQVCEKFTCSACGEIHTKAKLDGPYLWRPDGTMTKRLASGRAAVYVLCTDCSRKPESMTRPQIEATLGRNGLFGRGTKL